ALLQRGRQVRQGRRALPIEDRYRLYRAAVDLRLGRGDDLAQIIDAAALEVLHRGSGAAIGHVRHIDSDYVIEQNATEMRGGAGARRAELHLVLVGFRVADEVLEVVGR